MVQPLWKTVWRLLKKLKIELSYDRAIALLGIYPKDTDVVKGRAICTPMFIATMATVTKLERAKMPFNRRMDKEDMVHIYNGVLAIRKDEYPAFASTWMGLGEIMLSELSQAEKVNYRMVSLTCGM